MTNKQDRDKMIKGIAIIIGKVTLILLELFIKAEGLLLQGTQLHGWSPHWCDARCSCFVTAAW
jgi:hypothetical protein